MNLYYIHLGLDYYDYIESNNELRYEFQQHTNFIDDYFSKAIRKHKYRTDGTYNMISVSATEFELKSTKLQGFGDVIGVNLPFDRNRYEKIKGTEDCSYYLELLEEGFKKASEFKEIPLETLLNIIEEFKQGGYKNEWVHKKKRFKEDDLEVVLICQFTTNYFQLVATINQISTKKEVVSGVLIRTEVGVSIHEGMYKDVLVKDDEILITDKSDSPRIRINKAKIFDGVLDYVVMGDKEIVEMLSYQI
ncbi:hypothetical protein [uncultured Bacteroides sp.]|uniref:hypothetical protein n=1 Tax=uncultured Bacteroides sp. TaxID=162156 RepID=UPI002AAA8624|nr:hypothetical protein [uncultured Bacteroides sp.]